MQGMNQGPFIDGSSEYDAHVPSGIGNSICLSDF